MPLRIAHIVNEPFGFESANGVQQVVYCLALAQSEIGESVAVFSWEGGVRIISGSGETMSKVAASTYPVHKGSFRQRLLSRFFSKATAQDLLSWRPDFVHFHSIHVPRNVGLAAHVSCAQIPYCVTVHGALFAPALCRNRLQKTVFNLLFERQYLNCAQFIHALSPREATVIRREGVNRPIVVVPNGPPPDALVQPSRPDALYDGRPWLRGQRVFLFIGRLDPWQKGLDLLIKGWARAALENAALVLVGPDWFGSQRTLGALAERLGVSSQVVFTGPAFGDDRANLFAATDVFVHPSRWEGLSLSVLAAAAAGKPCLITREADPLGELERARAAVIVEATAPSIAAGLMRAATLSGDELRAMGQHAKAVAESQFNWPSIAARLTAAYRNVLEKDCEQ